MSSSQSYGHTTYYKYVEDALRARWVTFMALEAEMHSFEAKPSSAFSEERARELNRLQALNPSKSIEELVASIDSQFLFFTSPDWQFHSCFDQRHMADYVSVVMLAHALCEALINGTLAIGLAKANASDLFALVERAEFKQKWLFGPKVLATAYTFPRGSGLHESLVRLSRERNALVHLKLDLEIEGDKVLTGSGFERRPYAEEQRWLRRYFSLPYDLSEFLHLSIPGSPVIFCERGPIPRSLANGVG